MATHSMETDYLVIGAGAMGMAFTDAVIDRADVHVTIVDRRHAPGGHWQDAYLVVPRSSTTTTPSSSAASLARAE